MSIKKITISILILIFLSLSFFSLKLFKLKKEGVQKKEGVILLKEFKNGINPEQSVGKYKKIFENLQKISNIPIKYPTELPESYKLFKISVWRKQRGAEEINIYFGKENTNRILEKYNTFIEKNNPKENIPPALEEDNEIVILKETFKKPSFYEWTQNKKFQEIKAINKKTLLLINKDLNPWEDLPFKKILYIGYAKRDKKNYYYLINSNTSKEKILKIANSIIKNEEQWKQNN